MDAYVSFVRTWPLASAALQFAVLGTLGEAAAAWLRERRFFVPFPARAALLKALGWSALAVCIKYAFAGFTAFVAGLSAKGLLPAQLGLFAFAFAVSLSMNLQFGPFLVIAHRLIDNGIDGRRNWTGIDRALLSLLWFWVPAHTVTFMLPEDLRIGLAAVWSLTLGVILGLYGRPAGAGEAVHERN